MSQMEVMAKTKLFLFGKSSKRSLLRGRQLESVVAQAKRAISVGSLSFSLAASLLSRRTRDAVFMLYNWCRYCDDKIDDLPGTTPRAEKLAVLKEISAATESAYHEMPPVTQPVFVGFRQVVLEHDIPAYYPLEMLAGMAMDVAAHDYQTTEDLLIYCYRVAGIVGLMSSHILSVKDPKALERAAHMGMAMQITNVARDIFEDFENERVYLPGELLRNHSINKENLTAIEHRQQLVAAVDEMLIWADRLYRSGDSGIIDLPFRMAIAVTVARNVYADIGRKVRTRGAHAWDSRTWIPFSRKLVLVSYSLAQVIYSIPLRLLRCFRNHQINTLFTREQAVSTALAKLGDGAPCP